MSYLRILKYVSFVNFRKKHIGQFCQISGPENFKEYLIWQFSQNTSGYFGKEGGPHNLTNATFANFQMSYNLKIEHLPIKSLTYFAQAFTKALLLYLDSVPRAMLYILQGQQYFMQLNRGIAERGG